MRQVKFIGLVCICAAAIQAAPLPWRWVFVAKNLSRDEHVEQIDRIVQTAAEHGLNGMVLSAGLDTLDLKRPDYFERLERVRRICRRHSVELIPQLFSVGYGGAVLAHDRELAAGLPVRGVRFRVSGRRAVHVPDPKVRIVNGGFEDFDGHHVAAYRFHDRPGEVSFVDREVFHGGQVSLRFENFGRFEHGHGRVMQEIHVQPHRCYRLRVWVKTENLQPAGAFRFVVLTPSGRYLAPYDPQVPATTDWTEAAIGFNSLEYDTVRLYAGVWGGQSGRFWLDDWQIEEIALVNVLNRPGTPITVRDEATGCVYQPGRDYQPIVDRRRNFRFDHDGPDITLPAGSRIADGARLRVDYYHGIAINRGQVSVCMSEPKLYEIWRRQAELVEKTLHPKKYLLSMDEIRAGGSCVACKARGLTMGEILGDCITRQHAILRAASPGAEILIWSDMLDPNHNAHDDYYLVDGDFTGSWKYIPKDLVIVCWYYDKRAESLRHFSSLGFRTVAGAYYDGDNLDNPCGWLQALSDTPGAVGIMYTTWRNKYDLLGPFGDLVSR